MPGIGTAGTALGLAHKDRGLAWDDTAAAQYRDLFPGHKSPVRTCVRHLGGGEGPFGGN